MEINTEQYEKIKYLLPVPRGNVSTETIKFINAVLYVCENGGKWRKLPKEYGKWHPIYKRFNRWVKAGIINKLFQELHVTEILKLPEQIRFMDSMSVPVHPDACGALKKTENRQLGVRLED